MTRVLVVEDDAVLARTLAMTLVARGDQAVVVPDGAAALRAAAEWRPEVVVLDLGLPDVDGLEVIARLRAWSTVPVVVLSARDAQHDTVRALDAGADDFVRKPFGVDELFARIRAAVRRHEPRPDEPVVRAGDLEIDLAAARVLRDDVEVRLTPTEWHVLEVLVRRRGELVPRLDLLREVWGPGYARETHYLRVYLAQLRRKLEAAPSHPRHLVTEAGLGYRFET